MTNPAAPLTHLADVFAHTPAATVAGDAADVDAVYALVRRADLNAHEIEEPGTHTVEVSVLWKSAILHVAHVDAAQGFALVTEGRLDDATRFVVDESMLPADTRALSVVGADSPAGRLVFMPGTATAADMREGEKYRTEVGALTVSARLVPRPRKLAAGRRADKRFIAAGVGALVAVASLVGAMRLGADDAALLSSASDDDRLSELTAFLNRNAERTPEATPAQNTAANQGAMAPASAPGEVGRAGRPTARQPNGRTQLAHRNETPQVGRPPSGESVAQRGVFAALGGSVYAGQSGTVSPFNGMGSGDGATDTFGIGGDGDGTGFYGMGAVGTGFGGGCTGEQCNEGLVTAQIRTRGHCAPGDTTCREGFGTTSGTRLATRETHGPRVIPAAPTVSNISPELIRRVVQRNLPQVTHCHEQGLAGNPTLAGRVVIHFVIGSEGNVLASEVSESNLAVPSVGQCIASAVRRWSFNLPASQTGVVNVHYPFVLSPAE